MKPKEAFVAVTYKCNSRCSMCNIWKTENPKEMPPSEYSKLPTTLDTINITGGEPFLRNDLVEIVQVIHRRIPGVRIVFSTNGSVTDLIVDQIRRIRAFHSRVGVGVSIDGLSGTHDQIRGVKGLFDKAIATLESLKARGLSDLRLAMTIQQENYREVPEVFGISQRLGVEFSATMVHNSEIYFRKSDNTRPISDSEANEVIKPVVDSLLKSRRIKDWLRAYHMNGMIDPSVRASFYSRCQAGKRYFFVTPGGDVYPCNVMDYRVGNMTEVEDWSQLWTQSAREQLDAAVSSCGNDCWMVCNTRSMMATHPLRVGGWISKRKLALRRAPVRPQSQ